MRAWQAFLAASALATRRVEQQLKDQAGLSHVQFEVLVRLGSQEAGELRMTELADLTLTSKSGLTYQIDRLEQAGLVRRRTCESDVRGTYAGITDAGRVKLAEIAPGHLAAVREYVIDVVDRKQIQAFADALERIADNAAEHEWRNPRTTA